MPTQIQTIQTQNTRILDPIPVKLYLCARFREKKKEGAKLIRLQWDQPYSLRNLNIPVIKIDPSLKSGDVAILEIWSERREWISEERKIRAPEYMTRTIIKLYKPRDPNTKPKAIFVVAEYPLRSTRMGGYDDAELISNDGVLWSYVTENVSRSGNHGKRLFMIVANKPIRVHWIRVSNRGNKYSGIDVYDFDDKKSVPELEELETVKAWRYGSVVRMRNNITGEVFTALVLEYHEAWKTCARTTHTVEPEDAIEPIESTAHSSKTHWTEVYRVIKPCKVKTVRITNRGKDYEIEVEVQP